MFIRFLKISILSFFISSSAHASSNDAVNYVNDLANRVITIVKDQSMDENSKESQLINIFVKNVDTKWIARFAMGKHWRNLTPQQQQNYTDLYTTYLTDLYVPNFKRYTGNEVKVISATEVRPKEFLVQTELTDPLNKSNIKINYMLNQKDGLENFIIFDVVAEGVSLITSQRAEVNNIMDTQDFNALIALLIKKTSSNHK